MEHTEIQVIMRSSKKGYFACGVFDGKGLTVLKGSKVSNSVSSSYKGEQAYARTYDLDADGKTTKDLYFKSPSAASGFVCGRSANGWVEWFTPSGVKLGAFRGQDLKQAERPPAAEEQEEDKPNEPEHDHARDLKEKIEQMLLDLTSQDEDTQMVSRNVHTSIYYRGSLIASVYYRVREIRVEMRDVPSTHALYNELLKESLVYQKPSADPRRGPGKYQFFVSADDAETVLVAIIIAAQEAERADEPKKTVPERPPETSAETHIPVEPPQPRSESRAPETPVPKASDSKRIEKKLDYLLGMLNAFNAEKENVSEEQPKETLKEEKAIRLEATDGHAPLLMCLGRNTITGLIARATLKAIGLDETEEAYRVFFSTRNGNCVSNKLEIQAAAGREYTLRFELMSAASEEEKIFLIVQGINAAENEARQMIEFSVRVAFTADFGL